MTLSKHVQYDQTTQKDIRECLATIKSLHPNWNDSEPELTLRLWHHQLKTYPKNDVKRAVLDIASRSRYIPKLADVLKELEKPKLQEHTALPLNDWDKLQAYEDSLTDEKIIIHREMAGRIQNGEDIGNEYDKLRAKLVSELKELVRGIKS